MRAGALEWPAWLNILATQVAHDGRLLDCGARHLVYHYAKKLQPWHNMHEEIWDALEIERLCGAGRPPGTRPTILAIDRNLQDAAFALYVAPDGEDLKGNGSKAAPFRTIHHALEVLRSQPRFELHNRTVILRGGVHFVGLNGTLRLSAVDSDIHFVSCPGETAWLSGAIPLRGASWEQTQHPSAGNNTIWRTTLQMPPGQQIRSLFTVDSHERLAWARYPNSNIETDQWGYSSPGREKYAINSNQVLEWTKRAPGMVPAFTAIDLTDPSNPSGVIKNDSSTPGFNVFNEGIGGVCKDVWEGPSYWCGNESDGGWAEIDYEAARAGQLQIPTGMQWNASLSRLSEWGNPVGAWVHAWHSQTWAMHMFQVASFNASARTMAFSPSGGSQGGRNWCRCDQCEYAAGLWSNDGNWCGRLPGPDGKDARLIGGNWLVEGVFEELDRPGEFWYNSTSRELWVWPNNTWAKQPPDLAIPVLESIISIDGASRVVFERLAFRDAVSTYNQRWGVPSGGDWAFHRNAGLLLSGTNNVTVHNCTFHRLDGNAILLSGYNRGSRISRCSFRWIGQTAAAAWGETRNGWDGRDGKQPRGSVVEGNIFRDVGLFQKQSAGWFQAKAAETILRSNIMFNMPRAAINFNDGFGGGNVVEGNLIFNTCRESGDHGPINTWDRQPFLTDVAAGQQHASFVPATTEIAHNFIWANYGAAQGVDNDDGSSHYWIHDNVFYDADGFKMDYGGHGSVFERNLVVTKLSRGQCLALASFLRGYGDIFRNNTCWLMGSATTSEADSVGLVDQCDAAFVNLSGNRFGTAKGNATLNCGGRAISIGELYSATGVGDGSTSEMLPTALAILQDLTDRLQTDYFML